MLVSQLVLAHTRAMHLADMAMNKTNIAPSHSRCTTNTEAGLLAQE